MQDKKLLKMINVDVCTFYPFTLRHDLLHRRRIRMIAHTFSDNDFMTACALCDRV